ncbi:MAG: hypothetical protein K6B41_11495, partial [Butyrivibrio sp.]|nr:hypothetical protein [Butyrivibrio sp.]
MGNKEWSQLWLRYKKVEKKYDYDFENFYIKDFNKGNPVIGSIISEYKKGISELLGINEDNIKLLDEKDDKTKGVIFSKNEGVLVEGFEIQVSNVIDIKASDEKGLLYGLFHLLRLIARGIDLEDLNIRKNPSSKLRMLNHWDNMDGSIERGYSGQSFFF